ncbi:MAG: hypothetical protein KGV50_03370 [Gammaproteobacteria bacterium]|nr:hypothetical protein [Gammaproteobacteria bacterium]
MTDTDKQAFYEKINQLAQDAIDNIPAVPKPEQPTFTLLMGTLTHHDVADVKAHFADGCVFLHIFEAFTMLTEKSSEHFTQQDIADSMFLASTIALKAFHKRCSIVLDVGYIDEKDMNKILTIVKALGYQTSVNVISSDDVQQKIAAMSEEELWQASVKDAQNCDLVTYLFEDLTGSQCSEETLEMLGKADNVILCDTDGEQLN